MPQGACPRPLDLKIALTVLAVLLALACWHLGMLHKAKSIQGIKGSKRPADCVQCTQHRRPGTGCRSWYVPSRLALLTIRLASRLGIGSAPKALLWLCPVATSHIPGEGLLGRKGQQCNQLDRAAILPMLGLLAALYWLSRLIATNAWRIPS